MFSDTETVITRNNAPSARFSLMDEMFVSRGSKADWDLLHHLHYKAEKLPIGPRFWKLELHGETIGVLVTGSPKGMLRERHMVFPNLKPGSGETRLTNTNRYHFINANFRVVSRFVVDTMYRGIGAGYRMMNLVSRIEGNTFMEIQSSMSKFNIFGQKAGFKFVKPMNANKYDQVMKFFRAHFESSPQDFEAILNEAALQSTPAGIAARCLRGLLHAQLCPGEYIQWWCRYGTQSRRNEPARCSQRHSADRSCVADVWNLEMPRSQRQCSGRHAHFCIRCSRSKRKVKVACLKSRIAPHISAS